MKTISAIMLTVAIAVPATWFAAKKAALQKPERATAAHERKPLYYQSAMHPWIKSDKPGRCTICGMELTPVYEGDAGFDAAGGNVVPLTKSMIQVINVETAEAAERPLKKSVQVAGNIEDNTSRHRVMSAYVPGRIQKLYVSFEGAEVKEGQPLAEFYSPALLQAEREYRLLSGELRDATALRLRQMGLTAAQIADLPNKPKDILTSQILAPIGGTVVLKTVYEGQYVQEGEKLFEIADFSTMWFQFSAYEQDLPWIKTGQEVDVTTPSAPGKTFVGKVTFIDPNFDETTRSTRVRVELENPPVDGRRLLLHRLYADGVVRLDAPTVLTVPRFAVIQTGPEAVVYVDQGGGGYARRKVKIGRRGDELVEVLSGVQPGEKVVVNGNLLIDGQAEMNRSFAETSHQAAPPATNSLTLTEAQKKALTAFVAVNDRVSSTLARDDLAAFNGAGAEVMSATDSLLKALADRADLKDILAHIAEARHLHGAKDLKEARKQFHPFANASAKLLEMTDGVEFQVFECPMVNKAVEGVAYKGRWVQSARREIGNPYFGAEMLDCGQRILPKGVQ